MFCRFRGRVGRVRSCRRRVEAPRLYGSNRKPAPTIPLRGLRVGEDKTQRSGADGILLTKRPAMPDVDALISSLLESQGFAWLVSTGNAIEPLR